MKTFEVRQCKRCKRDFEAPMTNILTGGGFYCSHACSRRATRYGAEFVPKRPKGPVVIHTPQ